MTKAGKGRKGRIQEESAEVQMVEGEGGQHQFQEPLCCLGTRCGQIERRGHRLLYFPKPELDDEFQNSLHCPGPASPLTNGEQMAPFSQ